METVIGCMVCAAGRQPPEDESTYYVDQGENWLMDEGENYLVEEIENGS